MIHPHSAFAVNDGELQDLGIGADSVVSVSSASILSLSIFFPPACGVTSPPRFLPVSAAVSGYFKVFVMTEAAVQDGPDFLSVLFLSSGSSSSPIVSRFFLFSYILRAYWLSPVFPGDFLWTFHDFFPFADLSPAAVCDSEEAFTASITAFLLLCKFII